MNRVLIIKSGHSETWLDDQSDVVSFGDVFRTTAILRNFEKVDWLGSRESIDLLNYSSDLDFLELNSNTLVEIDFNSYELVINLEKHHLLKRFSFKSLPNFCGFFYDHQKNEWKFQDFEKNIFNLLEWNSHCEQNCIITWGQKLQFFLGKSLTETLGLIHEQSDAPLYDFGLNWQVGKKWPTKQIGIENWRIIEQLLSKNYSVSWQEGFDSINEYQSWIRKNRVLITLDSLGMHLSLALKKPTLAIFTATSSAEVDSNPFSYFYSPGASDIDFNFIADSAIKLLNEKYSHAP